MRGEEEEGRPSPHLSVPVTKGGQFKVLCIPIKTPVLSVFLFCISKVKYLLDEILERLPESFNMLELHGKVDEKTPYVLVALQECERMNTLTDEIRRSLKELDLGLKVLELMCTLGCMLSRPW